MDETTQEDEGQPSLVVLAISRTAAAIVTLEEGERELLGFGTADDQERRQHFAQEAANAADDLGGDLVVVHEPWPPEQPAWELWGRWLAELEHVEVPPELCIELVDVEDEELPLPVNRALAPALRLGLRGARDPAVLAALAAAAEGADE